MNRGGHTLGSQSSFNSCTIRHLNGVLCIDANVVDLNVGRSKQVWGATVSNLFTGEHTIQ